MKKIKTINQGGFGEVSLYESKGALYAVKQMIQKWDGKLFKLFIREIDVMKALNHPNIVKIKWHSQSPDNPYYIMPYFKDGSLRDKLQNSPVSLPVHDAIRIIHAIAEALSYAHSNGVIHRDLKPENILFDGEKPMIADWGIGKFVHKKSKVHTAAGMGTQTYCAPEQWNYAKADARSDIYSLGIIFTELITGKTDGKLNNQRLNEVIQKMTAYHPENRYQSMQDFLIDLSYIKLAPSVSVSATKPIYTYQQKSALTNDEPEILEIILKGLLIGLVLILAALGISYVIKKICE